MLTTLAAVFLATPLIVSDSVRRPVTPRQVQLACAGKGNNNPQDSSSLTRFCMLGAHDWDTWRRTPLPAPAEIQAAAESSAAFFVETAPISTGAVAGAPVQVSNLLNAAADFLVKRTGQEIRAWFWERFTTQLCKKSGLRGYLTNTCAILQTETFGDFMPGVASLQAALRKDLRILPGIMIDTRLTRLYAPHSKPGDSRSAAIADRAVTAYQLIVMADAIADGGDLAYAVLKLRESKTKFGNLTLDCTTTPTASMVLETAAFTVDLLGARINGDVPETDRVSVLKALAVNAAYGNVPWPTCDRWAEGNVRYVPFVAEELYSSVGSILALADSLSALQTLNAALEDSGATVRKRLQVFGRTLTVASQFLGTSLGGQPSDRTLVQVFLIEGRLLQSIGARNYAGIQLDALELLRVVGLDTTPTAKGLARALSFGAEIAQAPDVQSASAVIDQFAAPVGSYRRKRAGDAGTYFGLNAYGGVFIGNERAANASTTAVGPQFPIGLEFGGPTGKGWSIGAFAQIIDLGALAAWRLKAGGVSQAPETSIKQVFSPGLFLVLGLPHAPLTFGVGRSWTPELRKVGSTGTPASALRTLSLFAAIDIPLLLN